MEVSASAVEIPAELSMVVPAIGHNVKTGTQRSSGTTNKNHFVLKLDGFDFVPTHAVLFTKSLSTRITEERAMIVDWSSGSEHPAVTYARNTSSYAFNGMATNTSGTSVTYVPPEGETGAGSLDFYSGSLTTKFIDGQTWYYVAWD